MAHNWTSFASKLRNMNTSNVRALSMTHTWRKTVTNPIASLDFRRHMSHGVCFSPFPRNELEILEFNLRQQIKQRRLQFEKHTQSLIEDMKQGKIPITLNEQDVLERLKTEMKRPLTSREERTLRMELMKAFDSSKYYEWIRTEERKLIDSVNSSIQHIRELQKNSIERVIMTRNKAALILSQYLERYPDREETERLWDQRFLLPGIEWDEGGDFTRSTSVGSDIGFGRNGNDCL